MSLEYQLIVKPQLKKKAEPPANPVDCMASRQNDCAWKCVNSVDDTVFTPGYEYQGKLTTMDWIAEITDNDGCTRMIHLNGYSRYMFERIDADS